MIVRGLNLKTALQGQGIRQEEAAKKLGVSRQTLSSWCNKQELTKDILQNVKTKLNIDLISSQHTSDVGGVYTNTESESKPYFTDYNTSAGLSYLVDNLNQPDSYIKIPGVGVDFYINVFGDSMYPRFESGDIIGLKRIEKDLVFPGSVYVVEMIDGESYIKYIRIGRDDNHWSLESENTHYQARQFHLSKIRSVYKIKSLIKRTSI